MLHDVRLRRRHRSNGCGLLAVDEAKLLEAPGEGRHIDPEPAPEKYREITQSVLLVPLSPPSADAGLGEKQRSGEPVEQGLDVAGLATDSPVDGVLVSDDVVPQLVCCRESTASNLVVAVDQANSTLVEQDRACVRGVNTEICREDQQAKVRGAGDEIVGRLRVIQA